jgi:hypothetical protein
LPFLDLAATSPLSPLRFADGQKIFWSAILFVDPLFPQLYTRQLYFANGANQNWAFSVDSSSASTELSPPVTQFMTRSK